jgi:hypothetical protein
MSSTGGKYLGMPVGGYTCAKPKGLKRLKAINVPLCDISQREINQAAGEIQRIAWRV